MGKDGSGFGLKVYWFRFDIGCDKWGELGVFEFGGVKEYGGVVYLRWEFFGFME